MSHSVVIGAQWGDEGKGKVVDILSEDADLVVRFQGGNNAGHTLVIDGVKTVLHHIPSGVLQGVPCLLSGGVVVNPEVIWKEISELMEGGYLKDPSMLTIGGECSLIMPYHQELDRAREASKSGRKIGTTGRGIGPCYEDRTGRRSVFVRDLLNREVLEQKLDRNLPEKNAIAKIYGLKPFEKSEIVDRLLSLGEVLKPYIRAASPLVHRAIDKGERVLFEGAQGTLLDIGHGNYPYVTSSHTITASACVGAGIAPQVIERVVGIAKAYCTRVGEGPFPTELHDEAGERLRTQGHEFGSTTGRPRRCGWLDIPAIRYAAKVNGFTEIALMKLDVLSGFEEISIATSYVTSSDTYDADFICADKLARVVPEYEILPGWSQDLTEMTTFEELPKEAQSFVNIVEKKVGVPITYVSVGPGRKQTLRRQPKL